MKIRDNLNTLQGYKELIDFNIKFISEGYDKINSLFEAEKNGVQKFPKPNLEVIKSTKETILLNQYNLLFLTYSAGETIANFKIQYLKTIASMEGVWKKSNGYVQMVFMLSIGVMLEIETDEFDKLVKLVEKDNPQDFLIDFLVKSRKNNWVMHDNFMWKKPYQITKGIVTLAQTDKEESLKSLKKYLQKEWFKSIETKTHDSKFNIHSGYWSFESGALVKILGLDDSSLKDQQYYPYDLVHYKV